MPTVVVSRIGTAGVDREYSTVQAWEDAAPASLTAVDQVWKGECYNDSEFVTTSGTFLMVSGITTDATRFIWLTAASGQSFADHPTKTANARKYDASKGVGFRVNADFCGFITITGGSPYTRIERLQFYWDTSYASNYFWGIYADNGQGHEFRSCLFQTRGNGGTGGLLRTTDGVALVNCAFVSLGTGPNYMVLHFGTSGTARNCTFLKASDATAGGIALGKAYSALLDVRNSAVFGPWTTAISAGLLSSASNRIFTDAASVDAGTNHSTGLSASAQFQGTTIAGFDARPKSTSAFAGAALRDAAYTNDLDILGNARSITAPWIGAEELGPSGPTLSLPGVISITASSARPQVTLTY